MKYLSIAASAAVLSLLVACESLPAPPSQAEADTLHQQSLTAIQQLKQKEPESQRFFDTCYAYAIFPDVSAGAVGVGGGYGRGEVYQKDKMIGYADLSQANVGVQLGGESFSEIIFFQNEATFKDFRAGTMDFDARAGAVAASHGDANVADYKRGVAVYAMTQSGLMAQAAIGGQRLRFQSAAMASERD